MSCGQERQRQQLEEERVTMTAQLNADNEQTSNKLTSELEHLRVELTAAQRDRDQQLMLAESDHQQVNVGLHYFD